MPLRNILLISTTYRGEEVIELDTQLEFIFSFIYEKRFSRETNINQIEMLIKCFYIELVFGI